ncbi:MAG: cbb3-type cytochrome c oxidase subunit I [Chthoniobacterales bacterium]
MSQGSTISISSAPVTTNDADRLELAAIDRSVRLPVLFFFGSAIFWLLVSSLLGMISAVQINQPWFLDNCPFLTFGRVRPAHLDSLIYGWASAAGIGVGIWLMARLSGVVLKQNKLLIVAGIFWNVGNLIGVLAILAGYSQSIEWLNYPSFAALLLFIAYGFIAIWGIIIFQSRKPGGVYVSQWYLLAAFLCFPWLYATANTFLVWHTIQGSAQTPINWWYAQGIFGLWFVPLGLASAYYFIPRIVGRPIHSYQISVLAFWAFVLLFSWSGMRWLIGGPIPAWMSSVSIVASVLLVIPIALVAINHYVTIWNDFDALSWSPTLRFTMVGALAFTVYGVLNALSSLAGFNAVIQFTDWNIGHFYLGMVAFFSMMMFGAMYYIVPRLVGWEWPCIQLISKHFWLTFIGAVLMVFSLKLGGLIQGFGLDDPKIDFITTVKFVSPFRVCAAAFGLLIVVGNIIFACHFVRLLLKLGIPNETATSTTTRNLSGEAVRV